MHETCTTTAKKIIQNEIVPADLFTPVKLRMPRLPLFLKPLIRDNPRQNKAPWPSSSSSSSTTTTTTTTITTSTTSTTTTTTTITTTTTTTSTSTTSSRPPLPTTFA